MSHYRILKVPMPTDSHPVLLSAWALGLALVLAGCSAPKLDTPISAAARQAPYPELVPLEGLQLHQQSSAITETTSGALLARAAALRARAARLRQIYGS